VFSIPAYQFLTDYQNGQYDHCRVDVIKGDTDEYAILGTPFLYNYYQIYDFEQSKVGLFIHKYSEGTISDGGIDRDATKLPGWAIFVIIAAVAVVLILIVGIICIRRRNKRLQNQLVEYSKMDNQKEQASTSL
jgi:hypothetical protein